MPRPRWSAWRCRTTWCAAMTTQASSNSFGTPPASSTTRPEFGEDFVGVLAEPGRRRPRRAGRAVEIGWRRHHRHTDVSVGYVDDAARGVKLFVGNDVFDRVDRRPEEFRFRRKDLRPFAERFAGEDPVEFGNQFGRVGGTGMRRLEARIRQ